MTKIIGFFQLSGDEDVGDLFTPYVWGENCFTKFINPIIKSANYGIDLKLILIQYYVEGKFDLNAPDKPKLSNYSSKKKDIAVTIHVTRDKFHDVSDSKRRQFIVETTLQAIDMVEKRLSKRKLDINFDALRKDIQKAAKEYLKSAGEK